MEMHDALEAFARGQGLLPSSAALGRYLTEICGCREYPSVEPTAEFVDARGATLVVAGRDLATWSTWRGLDPEINTNRRSALVQTDLEGVPLPRRISIGLEIGAGGR
jgi:hypothetical protein